MDRTHHVTRKFIAIMPLLLICGIIAQMVLLIMAVILYIPALIFPALLNGIYRTITKAMAHLFAQSLFGRNHPKSRPSQAGMVADREIIPLSVTRRARCLPLGVSLCYNGRRSRSLRRHNDRMAGH